MTWLIWGLIFTICGELRVGSSYHEGCQKRGVPLDWPGHIKDRLIGNALYWGMFGIIVMFFVWFGILGGAILVATWMSMNLLGVFGG